MGLNEILAKSLDSVESSKIPLTLLQQRLSNPVRVRALWAHFLHLSSEPWSLY